MLERLSVALVQLQACNISKNVLIEIRQTIYFCIEKKKLLKKYITI